MRHPRFDVLDALLLADHPRDYWSDEAVTVARPVEVARAAAESLWAKNDAWKPDPSLRSVTEMRTLTRTAYRGD